jgi:hypothetical protein
VIQLVVKAILAVFSVKPGEEDKGEDDKEHLSRNPSIDIKENRTVAATIKKVSVL